MTRFEAFKEMDIKEVADLICDAYSEHDACDKCIASDKCYIGHTGLYEWLKEEI